MDDARFDCVEELRAALPRLPRREQQLVACVQLLAKPRPSSALCCLDGWWAAAGENTKLKYRDMSADVQRARAAQLAVARRMVPGRTERGHQSTIALDVSSEPGIAAIYKARGRVGA